MTRKFAWLTLFLLLLLPGAAAAAPLCGGKDCVQFMREQAASTRADEPRGRAVHSTAKPRKAAPRPVAARPKPAPLHTDAVSSFASQGGPFVPVFPVPTLAPETVGAAPSFDRTVQLVAADEFNDIDRKTGDSAPLPAAPVFVADAGANRLLETQARQIQALQTKALQTKPAQTEVSWLGRLWSAIAGVFAALSAAVHQLTGL